MIALYVLSGIAALILILLMLRIKITVMYKKNPDISGEPTVYLGIGPVKIKLYPKKEKPLKLSDFSPKKYRLLLESDASAPKSNSSEKNEKSKNELLPGGIGEAFELVLELIEKFRGKLCCEVLRLHIDVATKDAASTALMYSAVSSSLAFLLETLDGYTVMKLRSPRSVFIAPDFESSEFSCDIGIKFSIRTVNILSAGWGFIKNYFRTVIRLDNQNK